MKCKRLMLLLLLSLSVSVAIGDEISVNTSDGESYFLEVDPQERLVDLEEKILALSDGNKGPYLIEVNRQPDFRRWCLKSASSKGGYLGYPRNYDAEITQKEKEDIRFVVTKLAKESLFSLAFIKSDLEAAGDRIDHVHPLRFLMTVFTDEELKAGIRNIRGRTAIWGHFIGGLKQSLATEAGIGNMEIRHISHFADTVKINPNLIYPPIQSQHWEQFVLLLIEHIPRLGDQDRYDD